VNNLSAEWGRGGVVERVAIGLASCDLQRVVRRERDEGRVVQGNRSWSIRKRCLTPFSAYLFSSPGKWGIVSEDERQLQNGGACARQRHREYLSNEH
jgi:hypothetical protein